MGQRASFGFAQQKDPQAEGVALAREKREDLQYEWGLVKNNDAGDTLCNSDEDGSKSNDDGDDMSKNYDNNDNNDKNIIISGALRKTV